MLNTIEKEHIISTIRKFYDANDDYQTIQTTLTALGAEIMDCSEDTFIEIMNDTIINTNNNVESTELPEHSENSNSEKFVIICKYGTVNPTIFTLYKIQNGKYWTEIDMYYYDAQKSGYQKTDEEQYEALEQLANNKKIDRVIVDPAYANFIKTICRHKKYKIAYC